MVGMPARPAWLFGAVLLAACGGDTEGGGSTPKENRPPVVDGVEVSAEIAASGGRYAAPVRVSFHDDDGDVVTRIRVRIPDSNYDESTVIQGAVAAQKSATLTLDFEAASVPPGTYEFLFSVLDINGLESQAVSTNLTFK